MADVDEFSNSLLEESKRFLEKAKEKGLDPAGVQAYLHAALALGFCALEAHVNSISDDFAESENLDVIERSILGEKEFKLEKGRFVLTTRLKMYRLEERIEFLHRRFGGRALNTTASWWTKLQSAASLRNDLVHPKKVPQIGFGEVESALGAIIDTLEALFQGIYHRPFPQKGLQLDSTLSF